MNAAFLLASLLSCFIAESDWPQFRGGPAAGVVDQTGLPVAWDKTKNVIWKAEIPGRAWSSPIVWGTRIFVTSVVRDGKMEEPKKGLYLGGERKVPSDLHHWMIYCIDFNTGKTLWQKEAHKG